MSIQDKINEDLRSAMKAKEEVKLATLRMVKSDIQYEMTKTGASQMSDEQVISILKKNSKQRKDTAEEYRKANREDLASKEEAEELVIRSYLPKPVSEEEIKSIIGQAIEQLSAKVPGDAGKVIGKVMQELKGKNADGSIVSSLVKSILSAK